MPRKRKAEPKGAVYGLFDEYQSVAAASYNADIMLRQSRGEITAEQARAFFAPMPSEEDFRKRLTEISERLSECPDPLETMSDEQLEAVEKTARKEGFTVILPDIRRERNKRQGK